MRKVAAFALAAAFGLAAPAAAQRANGPNAGQFGGEPDPARWQGLDLSGAFFGAYDANLLPSYAVFDRVDERLRNSGASAGLAGSLAYERRGDRARFSMNGGVSARQYAAGSSSPVAAYQGRTTFDANLGPKVVFNAGGGAAYSPFFQFAPFMDAGISSVGPMSGGFDYATVAERNLSVDGTAGITSNFSKRTSAYASVTGHQWRLPDSASNNLAEWGGTAGIRHNLTRHLGVHAGYSRTAVNYAFTDVSPYRHESIDVGVDYGDTLSFARRTALTFSTSTSAIRYVGETHYRLNANAVLTRGFRRSWSAWLGYNRDTEFRIGFREPLLSDSFNTGFGGLFSRKVQWSNAAGYTRGSVGFGGSAFTTYSVTSRLDLAVTRTAGLFTQYAFYHYDVPPGASTLDTVPRFMRHALTAGLTVWLPLINDVRAPKEPQQP
jgi:hypothetical protein